MSAYDVWQQAAALECSHARALPDGADPFSGAYAEEARRLHIEDLKALEDLCGASRGTYVKAWYWDWSE